MNADKVNILKKIEIKEEIEKLKGKKVMLPLDTIFSNDCWEGIFSRYEHTIDVSFTAEKVLEHLKKEIDNKKIVVNKDIVFTISRLHDIGHCPYGHSGEETLNKLLSENGIYYSDNFFSGYKHNLLSAKIVLDGLPKTVHPHWKIIDGIIKHTSSMTSNFNISMVKRSNPLRLNYIFRDDNRIYNKPTPNGSWCDYIANYKCKCSICCKHASALTFINSLLNQNTVDFGTCAIADKPYKSTNIISFENSNYVDGVSEYDKNVCEYLMYPFPASIEGGIVKIADEISGLCFDFSLYLNYLQHQSDDFSKKIICKERIVNLINLEIDRIKEKNYDNQDEIINICNIIKKMSQDSNKTQREELKERIIKMTRIENNGCTAIVDFDHNFGETFNNLKSIIYSLVHDEKRIKQDNEEGSKNLKNLFNYYLINIVSFKNDPVIGQIIKRLNSLDNKFNIEKIDEYIKSDNSKIINALKREIVFYLASLTEQDVKNKVEQYNL